MRFAFAGGPRSGASLPLLLAALLGGLSWAAYRWAEADEPTRAVPAAVAADTHPPAFPERLQPTWPSAREAAEAFLDALAGDDYERLRATGLTEEEFADVVWPELPSSRPERNVPLEYAWNDLNQKSENSLRRMLHRHGGRRYTLQRVDFRDGTTPYMTFDVHREATLTFVDEQGRRQQQALFGSMIERGGRWKLFSFVVD